MKTNKLIIAAAGSGKTTFLVDQACSIVGDSVLITTYTLANEAEIKRKIFAMKGFIPSNITIQTWFSFLLQHGLRPYQSVLDDSIHNENIGLFQTNEKSGVRYVSPGKSYYWGEEDFKKHYFTNDYRIYSDKLSKFVYKCNEKSKDLVLNRISRIFSHIFVDEVQDLAGYDLELLRLFFKSTSSVLLVGDPRQVTYLTHRTSKHEKYADGRIREFITCELGRKIQYQIDETSLNVSHRNNQLICNYSAKLYPNLPLPSACSCKTCREKPTDHEGVFLIKSNDVGEYLSRYNPVQLRWSSTTKCNPNFQVMNLGESKGLSYDRVLIYPTKDMTKWIRNNNTVLTNETRAKFYVGITRASRSVGIIFDYKDNDLFTGIEKFIA